jgi:hypothetical protein
MAILPAYLSGKPIRIPEVRSDFLSYLAGGNAFLETEFWIDQDGLTNPIPLFTLG